MSEILSMNEEPATSSSSGFSWFAQTIRVGECQPSNVVDAILAESTPCNSELLEWAAQPSNQPPQSWWDETTDPFAPEDD